MDLNSVGYGELLRHPYLSKNDVNAIIQYRDFAGKIRNVEEIYHNSAIDSLTWKSIRLYLHTDEIDTASNNLLH